jgi:hypothetical protein
MPTPTPAFRLKSWRAFQLALDPLGRPRVLPRRRRPRDSAAPPDDVIVAPTFG